MTGTWDVIADIATAAALTASGLLAGLFAAFGYSVMPALARVDGPLAATVMQTINRVILNPIFGLIFGGGLVASVLAAVLEWGGPLRWYAVAAAVAYIAGTLVTAAANVPLNTELDRARPRGRARGPRGTISSAHGCGGTPSGRSRISPDSWSSASAW